MTVPADGDLLAEARAAVSDAPERALALADRAAGDADAAGARRAAALARQVRSRALRALGRHAEALDAFAAAERDAAAAGDPLLAAQVRIGAVDTLGMLARYDEAATLADALAARLGELGAPGDAARVLGNLGSLHLRRDRYEDALRAYARAEALVPEEDGGDEDGERAALRAGLAVNRAIALTYLGRYDEAAVNTA